MFAQFWNTTPHEQLRTHPADEHAPEANTHLVRAIDADADAATVFRWLCQLTVAPYSYDLLDNLGRRSPRALTAGAENLQLGQHFLVGPIVGFDGTHIVARPTERGRRFSGCHALSYQVTAGRRDRSRIVACLAIDARGVAGQARATALAAGDLVMMRKQLRTLAQHAERSAHV